MQFEKFCCYYSPQNHYLGINGVEMLTEQQLNSFNKNGFLVIDHVLDDEDLVPLEQEYNELLDTLATGLYREGKIDSAFGGCNFDERFARVVAQYPALIDRMNISLLW